MNRKVHSLIDKVYSRTNLELAWEKVKKNRGSAGVDDVSIAQFEAHKEHYLEVLQRKLREDTYRPKPVKRVEIGKADGGKRKLGIPVIFDRVCQQALVQRMEPIFEPKFLDCNYGYRKGRSPHDAMRKVWRELQAGRLWVVDADVRQFFDTVDQEKLVDLIAEEISDGRVLGLIRGILRSGVIEGGYWQPTLTGVPQGGVASPLWSNIYLTPFDRVMSEAGFSLTRWADDFVVLCTTRAEAERALAYAERFLREELGVTLHSQKTRIVHVRQGFEFLGYKLQRGKGFKLPAWKRHKKYPNRMNLYVIAREKSVKRFRDQIRSLTHRNAPVTLQALIDQINPVIRGWGQYYRKAHVRRLFNRLDRWIERRLYSFLAKRWRNTMWRRYPTRRLIEQFGLVRLTHLISGLATR
ncbi:MAG TPA: group II intron reverse transcriptase/maturase [Gammaproteobacteria bacterium]|jgi:group II intron reverse transcriptase/maturase|nr:group II intron reverse transcriptase/maturase [Gammaproteobacteria bacterium]